MENIIKARRNRKKYVTVKKFYILAVAVVSLAVGYFINYQQARRYRVDNNYKEQVINSIWEQDMRGEIKLNRQAIDLLLTLNPEEGR